MAVRKRNKYKAPKVKKQTYAELQAAAQKFADAVYGRSERTPYFYTTKPTDGKLNVVAVNDLYGYVMTAQRLGYATELRADADRLNVVFLTKLPFTPSEFNR
jgi:hypothetical protein